MCIVTLANFQIFKLFYVTAEKNEAQKNAERTHEG
jgi:hypothetical protein